MSSLAGAGWRACATPGPCRLSAPTPTHRTSIIVDVLIPVAVDTAYSYGVPRGRGCNPRFIPACRCTTSFATQGRVEREQRRSGNLKSMLPRFSTGRRSAHLRDFIEWAARWTLSPRGMCAWRIRAEQGRHGRHSEFGLIATGRRRRA